jgi:thioredoxin reductase (NADPH)
LDQAILVDAALETYRKGAEVTMIIRHSEISKSVKYWVKPDIENRLQKEVLKPILMLK